MIWQMIQGAIIAGAVLLLLKVLAGMFRLLYDLAFNSPPKIEGKSWQEEDAERQAENERTIEEWARKRGTRIIVVACAIVMLGYCEASADGPINPVRVTTQTIVRATPPELQAPPLLTPPPPPTTQALLTKLFGFPVEEANATAGADALAAAAVKPRTPLDGVTAVGDTVAGTR